MLSDLLSYLANKRLLIWGCGAEGASSSRFLKKHFPEWPLVLTDAKLEQAESLAKEIGSVEVWEEFRALERLAEFDLILKSPGISCARFAWPVEIQKKIRGQSELFLQFAPGVKIGVTGTKGKSTTSSLIAHLLSGGDRVVPLVGNIGVPPWEVIEQLHTDSCCVLELSSYQLEGVEHSPEIAVLLNLYQEHLNYHGTLDAYWSAKWNITRHQSPGQTFFYNGNCPALQKRVPEIPPGVHQVDFWHCPLEPLTLEGCTALRGQHNQLNAQAAVAVARMCGVEEALVQQRLSTFQGLPHRLELLGSFQGVIYYNDSISTVPESALAALAAIPETSTVILGGQNRGIDYHPLASSLQSSNLANIILVSETGEILRDLLRSDPRVSWVNHLVEAVEIARQVTPRGGVCLFSPAAPSYNQFRNFAERGELFRKLVQNAAD